MRVAFDHAASEFGAGATYFYGGGPRPGGLLRKARFCMPSLGLA